MAVFHQNPYIQLQALHQETPPDENMEQLLPIKSTKVIQNRLNTWKTYVVYLLPVACTAILLYINFSHLYWFPIGGIGAENGKPPKISSNNILNSLQLAAKLYEILVIASLAAIVLETYLMHLMGGGIPFALLTGAYRVFDVMYLLNPRFWRAAPRATRLAALLLLSVLFSTLAGPASAILIIPKLGWFPLPGAFSKVYMPLFAGPSVVVWPTLLNGTLWEITNNTFCSQQPGIYIDYCPASGFAGISTWTSGWRISGLRNSLTFEDTSGRASRRLDMWADRLKGTFVSGPTSLTTMAMGQFQTYFPHRDIGRISHTRSYRLRISPSSVSYQPLVNAKCNIWNLEDYRNASRPPDMSYPYEELNCFSTDPEDACLRIRDVVRGRRLAEAPLENETLYTTFEVLYGGEQTSNANTSSLVFSALLPYPHKGEMRARMAACSYMAHWIPSNVLLDPTNNTQLQSNITDLSIFADEKKWKKYLGGAMAIQIDRSWLPYLSLNSINTQSQNNNSEESLNMNRALGFDNIGALFDPFLGIKWLNEANETTYFGPGSTGYNASLAYGNDEVRSVLEKVTGTIVADAIARTAAFGDSYFVRPSKNYKGSIYVSSLANRTGTGRLETQAFANGTMRGANGEWIDLGRTPQQLMEIWKREMYTIYLEADRFGYGYGRQGGPGIFAFTVISIYVAVLLIYWAVTLYRRTNTVAALGDLQDLIALAWKSTTPPSLETQGVSIENQHLWQELVVVRATSSGLVTMALDKDMEQMRLIRLRKGENYL